MINKRYGSLLLAVVVLLSSCSGIYYGAMEKLGYPKRDLMVSRVKSAQKSQKEAKDEFRSALDRFKSVINFQGGTLEAKYDQLSKELERCESRAKDVHQRIASVEDVSEALFDEWAAELKQYKNQELRRISERKLDQTKERYAQLIRAMKNAESRIEPVIQPLRDDVLFLKHNLNAQAIASLSVELDAVQTNVDSLVADLERSIAEADRFIGEINREAQ
jgi:hypothetical protein